MTNGTTPTPEERPSAADMDMRDEFASRAMQGFYASGRIKVNHDRKAVAKEAYDQAEAMLEERKNR